MSVNMDYKQFRKTMTNQRQRLRKMIGAVDDTLYENLRDTYMPQLYADIMDAVPIDTGKLAEQGISFVLKRTRKQTVSLTVSAKAYAEYNHSYNYAYVQHEDVTFSHEHGTHHYVSGPFERMLQDIADMEDLDYIAPADDADPFGGMSSDDWAGGMEGS